MYSREEYTNLEYRGFTPNIPFFFFFFFFLAKWAGHTRFIGDHCHRVRHAALILAKTHRLVLYGRSRTDQPRRQLQERDLLSIDPRRRAGLPQYGLDKISPHHCKCSTHSLLMTSQLDSPMNYRISQAHTRNCSENIDVSGERSQEKYVCLYTRPAFLYALP